MTLSALGLRRLLPGLLWISVGAAIAALVAFPAEAWVGTYRGFAPLLALGLVTHVGLVVILARVRHRVLAAGVLALLWLLLGGTLRTQALGDFGVWSDFVSDDLVAIPALLSSWLLWGANQVGPAAEAWLPPMVGAAAVLAWVLSAESVFARRGRVRERVLCGVLPAALPWPILFSSGFVEMSQLTMVFAAPALASYARFDAGARHSSRGLVACALWSALAMVSHGQAACLGLALLLGVLVHHRPGAECVTLHRLASVLLTFAVVVALVVVSIMSCGLEIHPGPTLFARELSLVVPLQAPPDAPHILGMFDFAHVVQVANILWLSAPIAGVLWLAILAPSRRRRCAVLRRRPLVVLAGLGWVGFAATFQFDLAFPGDYDLMTTGAVPVAWVALSVLGCWRPAPWVAVACVGGSGLHSLAVMSALLVPAGEPGPHPLGPAADGQVSVAEDGSPVLSVNGRHGIVQLRPGERTLVRIQAPAGARGTVHFCIFGYRGTPPPGTVESTLLEGIELCFPVDDTIVVLTNNLSLNPQKGAYESLSAPWRCRLPVIPGPLTFQAVVELEDGKLQTSNAVAVLPVP